MPSAMVIRAAGTNCEGEMLRGFERAGAAAELVHLDALIKDPARLEAADLIGFPGGFSYGDDIASGRIFAMKVRERLWAPLRAAVARGCPVIGACNGFQVLVQVGLLPGPRAGEAWPAERAPEQELSLSDNASGRFVDRWVGMKFEADSACIWTRGVLDGVPPQWHETVSILPVAHGEGRLLGRPGTIESLARSGRIAARYTDNFNGSTDAIAGVCDATGRVLGLMPHPERYLEWTRHPYWTRLPAELLKLTPPGLRMFQNAVACAAEAKRGNLVGV